MELQYNTIQGEKYNNLIKGLDNKSKNLVDKIINRIYKIYNSENKLFLNSEIFDKETLIEREKIYKNRSNYKKFGYLPINHREDSVFYYKCGLKFLDFEIDLKGKDILDCGAFVGDSALVFNKEFVDYNKIYCFEPTSKNYNLLEKTIKKNGLEKKVIAINKGVGNKNETLKITISGSASSVKNEDLKGDIEEIEIIKLDDFIKENNIIPGIIKYDIEGYEKEAIIGAEESIKKYKPILLISIYHTGKDFFEIKPLIESWNLGYKFKIVNNNPFHIFYETVMICY